MIGNGYREPRIIPVGGELPPMELRPERSGKPPPSKANESKGKPGKRQTGERFQCINAFIDVTMAGLTPAERAVWLILWRDTKPNGLAETSQASLARRAGVSDRAVRSALRRLERDGLVTVVHRGSLRAGVSVYRIRLLVKER
jgi:hypothetical protein